jgi:hypothetical protein
MHGVRQDPVLVSHADVNFSGVMHVYASCTNKSPSRRSILLNVETFDAHNPKRVTRKIRS